MQKAKYNVEIYDQIKLCMIADYYPKLQGPKGTMQFFVRSGKLAIHNHTEERNSKRKHSSSLGMTQGRFQTLLMLLEEVITSQPPLDYGAIIVHYEIAEEIDVEVEFKTQVNHRR